MVRRNASLSRARKVMSDLQEAEEIAEAERGSPKGRIVLAAPEIFGRLHVAPLICEFMALNPGIEAELLLANRMVSLVEEGVDAAIRIGNLRDSGDIARRLGAVRRVLVASPSYLARAGTPRQPGDLQHHHAIATTPLTAPRQWRFGSGESARDVTLAPRFVTNSVDAALWHAVQGGGLALALSYQVIDHVKRNELRIVMEDWEPPPYPIHFVYPSARLLSLKVSRLLEHIVSTRKWNFLEI